MDLVITGVWCKWLVHGGVAGDMYMATDVDHSLRLLGASGWFMVELLVLCILQLIGSLVLGLGS